MYTKENGKIEISTPYNQDFVKEIKAFGAKWNSLKKTWDIIDELEEHVVELLKKHYGYGANVYKYITIKSCDYTTALNSAYTIAGRPICRAFGRDSGATVCDQIAFLSGNPTSGGSMKNWRTVINKGSVIKIFNATDAILEAVKEHDCFELVEVDTGNKKDALLKRKNILMQELAEIEEKLKSL